MGTINPASLVLSVILVLIVVLALRSVIRQRKEGGCGCGCSSCSGNCPHCIVPANRTKEEKE